MTTNYSPLVSSNMAMENILSMEVLIGKSTINGPFSVAMFDYRRELMSENTAIMPWTPKMTGNGWDPDLICFWW